MIVRVYGLDWEAYSGLVMPAFARWLIEGEEQPVYQLYEHTRCAREEQFLPAAMQHSCTWPRAQTFVRQLPRGTHTRREYQAICSAEQFTPLSDIYVHRHPPQLYQNSDAVRTLWGALIEEYCQSWFNLSQASEHNTLPGRPGRPETEEMTRSEVVALLRSAGLSALAQEINTQALTPLDQEEDENAEEITEEEPRGLLPQGIDLGRHPAQLHLRGWLAQYSVRAMAIFELLACGRRCMPFGTRAGEMYESYCGYLTPNEVWQLALSLRHATPPDPELAAADFEQFRQFKAASPKDFRMVDEVLPDHADALTKVVRMATQYGLGLICSIG